MYRSIAVLLLILSSLSCSLFATPRRAAKSIDTIAIHRQVVQVAFPLDGSGPVGTGFAVSKRHILTAAHFCVKVQEEAMKREIPSAITVTAIMPDDEFREYITFEIQKVDTKNDICLISDKADHDFVPVVFHQDYQKLRRGQKVFVLGAPLGLFPTLKDGYISSIKAEEHESVFKGLLVSAPIYPGNSGSPIYDLKGRVIGMIIEASRTYNEIGWGPGSDKLLEFLDDVPDLELE